MKTKKEFHLWMYQCLNDEGEIFYCQKCLCEIQITRWKDTTDIKQISKPVFKNCTCGVWKE